MRCCQVSEGFVLSLFAEFKPIYDDSLEDDMMQDYLARRIEQQQAQRLRQYKKMLGHTTYGSELRQDLLMRKAKDRLPTKNCFVAYSCHENSD